MLKTAMIVVCAIFLVGCSGMDETTKMRIKQFSDACIEGNQGACMALSSYFQSRNAAALAGAQNFTAATGNAANWAVQQQNTHTYSGGGYGRGSVCNVNPTTGQEFCY